MLLALFIAIPLEIIPMATETIAAEARTPSKKKKPTPKKEAPKKSTPKKRATPKKKAAPKKKASPKRESSRDVQRQAEAARKEIVQTKAQIQENDRNIARGVSNLQRLEGDIRITQTQVTTLTSKVGTLKNRIAALESEISQAEKDLARLRADYLKAVKKMRVARKRNSELAFLFSSKNFAQGMRRMRYLKQFSEWREKQTGLINQKVAYLKEQRQRLAHSRAEMDQTLKEQIAAKQQLERQHASQDAIVVNLRRNGEALQAHLARKQAEANQLNNRVASLIAQEEAARKEAERRAAEEAARKEAARKAAQEEAARKEAERRAAEEAAARERELAQATPPDPQLQADKPVKKQPEKKQPVKKQPEKKQPVKKQPEKKQPAPASEERSYADARRRKPRSQDGASPRQATPKKPSAPAPAPAPTPAQAGGGDFASMKGSLPKPVSGTFKVISPFGRQSLPDLPDVTYDNPGVDVEVAKGATVMAVYAGKVSGVYVVPGFSNVVIVNHGNYYTVYGNLSSASVKVGDNVKQGQALGKVAADADDPSHSLLHFEVWKNREKLNPMSWVR
ncbi:MAG: peptidoglycan DD-metalloendopeptidase family protein [Muribaculaceae bacterium]|nr:peptidoglycan DD-metalloendopeptidase family protein [Muribaculaceae bacterium]